MPVPPRNLSCFCGGHIARCLCVGFLDSEWEWLEAIVAYHTEHDPRERWFRPTEVIVSAVQEKMEREMSAQQLWAKTNRSKELRVVRGEVRHTDPPHAQIVGYH